MSSRIRIVALGDSLTEGFGVAPRESYPARLELLLKRSGWDCRVINAGVSGDTCRQVLARLDRVVNQSPDLVILEIGINDILMGAMPERIHANVAGIVERLSAHGIPVALAGMDLPLAGDPDTQAAFVEIYPAIARTYDLVLIPLFLNPVWLEEDRVQFDGVHPTAEGYRAITDHLLPWVIQALEKLPPRSDS
ncbi:MAG: arylesterase [Desulfobacterales bacterium]